MNLSLSTRWRALLLRRLRVFVQGKIVAMAVAKTVKQLVSPFVIGH